MSRLVRFLFAATVVYSAWHVAGSYWVFYQFKDSVQQTVQFAGDMSDEDLRRRVHDLAEDLSIPLQDSDVAVERRFPRLVVEAAYTQPLALTPFFKYPHEFRFNVEAWSMRQAPPSSRAR